MRWRIAVLVILAGAPAACREATDPGPVVAVSVTANYGPNLYSDTAGHERISCDLGLRAEATGSGRSEWLDAVFRWYVGVDRSEPMDTAVVPADTIRASWRQASIGPGESQRAGWTLSAWAPFKATIAFRYQRVGGGPVRSASVTVYCGPAALQGVPPPSITGFASRTSGALEPGSTLAFDYAVTSPVGVWQTTAALSGPCDVSKAFGENLATAVSHSLSFTLPAACKLGVPMNLTVVARDAGLQETVRTLTLPPLVDTTPPTLVVMLFPRGGGAATTNLAGKWFTGDTLKLILGATDNHQVAAQVWEVLPYGFRDSLVAGQPAASQWQQIVLRPEWVGPIQLRCYARDASGNVSDTIVSAPGAITVLPSSPIVPAVTSVQGSILDFAFDPKRGALYVLEMWSVQVLSLSDYRVTSAIQLPSPAQAFDLSASGDSLVVALPVLPALGIVDLLRSPPAVTVIPVAGLDTTKRETLQQVQVAGNGKALVTTQGNAAGADRLFTVDLATGVQQFRPDAGNGGETGGGALERSFDRSVIVLNGGPQAFQRYESATDAFGPARTAPVLNGHPWVDGTGSHVAISSMIFDADLQFLFYVSWYPWSSFGPAALSPDGRTHYLGLWGTGVVRSQVSDGATIDRLVNPVSAGLIRVSPDGRTLVTAETGTPTSRLSIFTMQ